MPRATVITVSDSSARGEREDVSGPEACRLLRESGFVVDAPRVVPDDRPAIAAALREAAVASSLVVTTVGTGLAALAPRTWGFSLSPTPRSPPSRAAARGSSAPA
jgi:molybdopterin biosynthesis enzyme MoaB